MLDYVDSVHQLSRHVVIDGDGDTPSALEYSLAAYFLITTGGDGLAHQPYANPENWWSGNEVELGNALGARDLWNGLRRREFSDGLVLLNEPDASSVTVDLGGSYLTLDGTTVTSVTLGPKEGAVLRVAP